MNKEYIRNGLEYYMKVELVGGEDYEYQMLMKNTITGLLPLQLDQINHKQYLMYAASGLKPFWITLEKMWISASQLYALVDSLLETIKEIKRYLLIADNLVLEPESLFLDLSAFQMHFLYVPGYEKDIMTQMEKLMEYLLGKIDYEDSEGVVFAYGMYRILKEPTTNLEDIQGYMKQFAEGKMEKSKIEKPKNRMTEEPVKEVTPLSVVELTKSQKKSWKLIFSAIIGCVLISGIVVLLFLIYAYGIEIWKRNTLLSLGIGFLIDSMVFYTQWKKMRQEKEIAAVFQRENHCSMPVKDRWEFEETGVLNSSETTCFVHTEKGICKLTGTGEGTCCEIIMNKFPFVIGSYVDGVDFCLKEKHISRFHAVISEQKGEFYIKDLHSTNGTFVGEEKLEPEREKRIRNNDWIQLADVRFRFVIEAGKT